MKFNKNLLQDWVDIPKDINKLEEQLTQIGFEVEGIEADSIIDLAIPPNRGDCLSILGIARELSVVNKTTFKKLEIKKSQPQIKDIFPINIQNFKACPKYLGRVIKKINPKAKTPKWMEQALVDAGINSVSAIVDITNYVMLELGQPMHAFDLHAIDKEIIVRYAKEKEKLVLLDNTELTLQKTDLVIADQKKPLALAGVMGGVSSSVTDDTTDLLLECACFEPVGIRLTARKYKLSTESSYRFERIVDINLQEKALARATSLFQEILSGEVGAVIEVSEDKYFPSSVEILLRKERISKILGITPDEQQVNDILVGLEMVCEKNNLGWNVKVPAYRQDIKLEIDLIEEVARFIGYQSIPTLIPKVALDFKQQSDPKVSEMQIKSCLRCRNYSEVITYSFLELDMVKLFEPDLKYLQLINPISEDLSVMRTNLWPGLVKVLQYNENRQCNRLRIFEIGLKFKQDDKQQLQQEKVLAGLCTGKIQPEHWDHSNHNHDFYDVKGDLEALAKLTGHRSFYYKPIEHPALHPGKSAAIFKNDKYIGCIGELHPRISKFLDISESVVVFELSFEDLALSGINKFCCLSKFQGIKRDLAIIVDEKIIAYDIENIVKQYAGDLLQEFCIFDVYQGVGIEKGKKSMALSLFLQHSSRTLVEEDIKQIMQKVTDGLKLKLNATLR